MGVSTASGVSQMGIDFVQNMLVIEPSRRATDAESLSHGWISSLTGATNNVEEDVTMTNDEDILDPIEEDIDEELIASQSQLNLNEVLDDKLSDDSADASILDDFRSSKRSRVDPVDQEQHVAPSQRPALTSVPSGPQLFGEIGNSALLSSGVFNYTAHAALDIPLEEVTTTVTRLPPR